MAGPLEMAVANPGVLHIGRSRSREVWQFIQGQQPVRGPSDPCHGSQFRIPKRAGSLLRPWGGGVWEMAGQQGQGTETGLSESLEPPGCMGVSQPLGWLLSGQTPRRHSQDSDRKEIRSSPLRLKEAACAEEALDLKPEHLLLRPGFATNGLCELGQTPWHLWVSEGDLKPKDSQLPGIKCKIKCKCIFLG